MAISLAHRLPQRTGEFVRHAMGKGIEVIIAGGLKEKLNNYKQSLKDKWPSRPEELRRV